MWKWVTLTWGLLAAPAWASDSAPIPPMPEAAVFAADPPGAGALDEAEAKRQERMAAIEAAQSKKAARVVVLKWQGEETDFSNETLQRNVKTRIARPDAKFYPDVDLYQAGRKEPDPSVRPADQRGTVPASAPAEVMAAVEDIAPVPWNAMSESDWGLKANELRETANKIWFVDRPELREPLFQLYVQIGRAAENQNNPAPPFYDQVGGMTVNWYWYLAGAMGYVEPGLMSKLTDQDLYASVDYYKQLLDSGRIQNQTLAFQVGGVWDAKAFAGEYQVFINGLEVTIDDKDSLLKVPPGRVDVYLKRSDGHSISDSIDITKLADKIYFVRDVAQKKMGIDFISQLMEHPNECTPELDGEIMKYLAIYARLHLEAEIYVAVPEVGNPNRILLWRWDRPTGTLQKVLDNTGGFPVRFAVLGGIGATFAIGKATVEAPDPEWTPGDPPPTATVDPGITIDGIPLSLQLRGHYGRLLVLAGLQGTFGAGDSPSSDPDAKAWADLYQTDGEYSGSFRERRVSRMFYGGVGVVLFKDAAIGMGPRGYIRAGTVNVPHVVDLTGHVGITKPGPLGGDGRVRSVVDVDVYGGVGIPYGDSIYEKPIPVLGLLASAGLTF